MRRKDLNLAPGVYLHADLELRVSDVLEAARKLELNYGPARADTIYLAGWLDGVRWVAEEMAKATLRLAQHPLVQKIDELLPDPSFAGIEDILATVVVSPPTWGDDDEPEDTEPAAEK